MLCTILSHLSNYNICHTCGSKRPVRVILIKLHSTHTKCHIHTDFALLLGNSKPAIPSLQDSKNPAV